MKFWFKKEKKMKFEIKNRWTGDVKFTAEIDATDATPLSVRKGLAVKWALANKIPLRGSDLSGEALDKLLAVDPADWTEAVQSQGEFFDSFGSRIPKGIREEHERLAQAIQTAITPDDMRGRAAGN